MPASVCCFHASGSPYAGTASYFSFNDPNGMCRTCSGLGKITKVDVEAVLDMDKSWNEGCVKDSLYRPGSWYWKQYAQSGLFDLDKLIRAYSGEEYNLLLYGSRDGKGEPETQKVTGLYPQVHKDASQPGTSVIRAGTPGRNPNHWLLRWSVPTAMGSG